MNSNRQPRAKRNADRIPLYSSPWIALFFVLRNEFSQPRPVREAVSDYLE